MSCYLLFYELVEGYAEKRLPYQKAHQEHTGRARASGELLVAGLYGDPPRGAAFLLRVGSASAVRAFAETDSYVQYGIVHRWWFEPYEIKGESVLPPD
jgi:uncharacterized protein YciI